MSRMTTKAYSTVLFYSLYMHAEFRENLPIIFVSYPANKQTNVGENRTPA